MEDLVQYQNYVGSVRYSDEDEVFHGTLEGIRDLVTRDAVDDYLATCEQNGRQPGRSLIGGQT